MDRRSTSWSSSSIRGCETSKKPVAEVDEPALVRHLNRLRKVRDLTTDAHAVELLEEIIAAVLARLSELRERK